MNSSLLEELGYIEESGNIDSSLFDLLELVFCNIPPYLDNTRNNEYFSSYNNHVYLDGSIIDPSMIYDKSDEIIDKIIKGNFFDFTVDGLENFDGTGNPFDLTRGDVRVNETPTHIPGYEPDGYGKPIDYTYDRESDSNTNVVEHTTQQTSEIEPPFTGFGKSAIVEWAADTAKWNYEPYELWLMPGDGVNQDTIIGKCLQQGKMKPIRSIFSQGVVRVDPSDGGYGRCAKTICHNHIIIDGYELAREKSWDGSDVSYLMKHPMMIHDFQVHQEEAMDSFYLMTDIMPYLLYLDLIYKCSRSEVRKKCEIGLLDFISEAITDDLDSASEDVTDDLDSASEAATDEMFNTDLTEDVELLNCREKEPEDEFSDFINGKYLPRKMRFLEDVKNLYGGDGYTETIKATKGNVTKLKEFGEKMIKLKNDYYDDIVEMCNNPGFGKVDILPNHDETSTIESEEYSFVLSPKKMDFEFEHMIKGEGETLGEQYANGKLEKYSPIGGEKTFSEYFRNIAKMIRGLEYDVAGGDTMEYEGSFANNEGEVTEYHVDDSIHFSRELKDMLLEFADSHPTSGDARSNILDELAKLSQFKDKITSIYDTYKIEKIDKEGDKVLVTMFEKLPEEAKWPLPKDFEYRGEFFRKWTFPNIDEMCPKRPYDDDLNYIDPINYDYAPAGYDGPIKLPEPIKPGYPDVEAMMNSRRNPRPISQDDPRTYEKPGEIEIGDIDYWRKYLAIATIVTLPFLATGLYIPPAEYIMLPCIYIPLTVVNISKVGISIVVGLAIRGVSINVLLIYVNLSQDANTVLLPVTILLSDLKEIYFDDIKEISNMIPVIANGMLNSFKSNNVAMLKENKRYLAEMTGLDALQLPSKTDLEKMAKEAFGEDTRQKVIRLEEDAKRFNDEWNNLKDAYTDFETGFRELVEDRPDPNNSRQG